MAKALKKSNPGLVALIHDLKQAARENEAPIWRDLAKRLSRPRANWAEVNLSRIERHTAQGDTVVVPGKLLGAGEVSKAIKVAAFQASRGAQEKVESSGGTFLGLRELMKENPSGSGIRIVA